MHWGAGDLSPVFDWRIVAWVLICLHWGIRWLVESCSAPATNRQLGVLICESGSEPTRGLIQIIILEV